MKIFQSVFRILQPILLLSLILVDAKADEPILPASSECLDCHEAGSGELKEAIDKELESSIHQGVECALRSGNTFSALKIISSFLYTILARLLNDLQVC